MKDTSVKDISSELGLLINKLSAEGTIESDGTFTISPGTAAKTMQRFRLPDPQMYLLQMIATAVSAAILELTIETAPRTLTFHFPGLEIQEEQLTVLDTFLFPGVDAPPHLVEMTVGIAAALNFAEEVQVESSSANGWWRLAFSAQGMRLEPMADRDGGSPLCVLTVRKKREVRALWRAQRHPELAWLEACRHAPLTISVDKTPFPTELLPPLPSETILWAQIGPPPQEEKRDSAQATSSSDGLEPSITAEHALLTGYLVLTNRETAYRNGLIFVHRGLIIHRPLIDLGTHVVSGVIHCDTLKKNLSQTDFVEDANFQAVRLFLKHTATALVTEFCREPQALREHWKHLWATVVNLLGEGVLAPQQETVIRSWAALVHETGESQSPFSSLQKARFLEKEGHTEAAVTLRHKLLNQLKTEALNLFESGQFLKLLETCEVLKGACYDLDWPYAEELRLAEWYIQALLEMELDLVDQDADDPLTLHRIALLRRWGNDLVGAIEAHLKALEHTDADALVRGWGIRYCAELEFSQQRYDQADELYKVAELELPRQRDLWEEQAFFKRFLGQAHRDNSFSYLKRALEGVEADSFVHWLLVEELKKEGRSFLNRSELAALQTKSTYLKLKRLLEEGDQAKIEACLKENLDLSGWTAREDLMARKIEAVLQAERTFGPTYLYTRYCRRRCVYQLHRLGALKEAEHLQCRGHLLEHLRMILVALPEPEPQVMPNNTEHASILKESPQ